MDDLSASIKTFRRERDLIPFLVLAFALVIGLMSGEDVWGNLGLDLKEAFVAVSLLVVVYGVFSIRVILLQNELRTLSREYWGPGPKAPTDEDI